MAIQKIELPIPGLQELRSEARGEGYAFIEKLVTEWVSGENRFDAPGEILVGEMDQGQLVAVGGLNRDPFVALPEVGRIRRVYVRPAWRNTGLGKALVLALLEHASRSFLCVRLRAENCNAARLYESMGFSPFADPTATHILTLESRGQGPQSA